MNFRTGEFQRDRVTGWLRPFCPAEAADSIYDIPLEGLRARGIKLILLDVDNTLVHWHSVEIDAKVHDWVDQAKKLGFELCILSNTKRVSRLQKLTGLLDIDYVRGKFKPSREMYHQALLKYQLEPHEAVMIGDQLFTDVFGANRAGIEAIWVKQLSKNEFHGTRWISRVGERLIRGWLYRALLTPIDEEAAPKEVEREKPLLERTIVRQFVKFLIVGGSSFVIDSLLRWGLMYHVPYRNGRLSIHVGEWLLSHHPHLFSFANSPEDAAFPLAVVIAASVAILNSFIWNRLWTFQIRGKEQRAHQMKKFILIAVIGLTLNTVISTIVSVATTPMLKNLTSEPHKASVAIATVIAAAVVAIWNFTGQRLYAFKSTES